MLLPSRAPNDEMISATPPMMRIHPWNSTDTSVAAYLRPDAAWVARWLDLSPYQHPSAANSDGAPSTASAVVYEDANQWAGIGFDNAMRMWFRLGPNGSGTYYYLGAGGASFPSLTVGDLTCTVGNTSPSTSSFAVGNNVQMYCVNGSLYALSHK